MKAGIGRESVVYHVKFTLFQPTTNGSECVAGEFCPQGSAAALPCTAGDFCNSSGLAAPVGPCDAGWHCPPGSTSQRQLPCARGSYCPLGSDLPQPCRNGTYGDADRLAAADECRVCDPARFCNEVGATQVSGDCAAGHYCPSGQTTPTPYEFRCWVGHMCPVRTGTPIRCASGYHQNEVGQATCKVCPAGGASTTGQGPKI